MKYLVFVIALAICSISSKNMRSQHQHIVVDRSVTGAELSTVVRRNPTITAVHTYGVPTAPNASPNLSFGANNDDNGFNVGGGFGKTAAIASNPS